MISSTTFRSLALIPLLVLSLVMTACAGSRGEPLQYTDRSDIPEGPGLLTGEEGAFTMSFGSSGPDEDSRSKEYEEFQRWKEWREYQDWKQRRQRAQ